MILTNRTNIGIIELWIDWNTKNKATACVSILKEEKYSSGKSKIFDKCQLFIYWLIHFEKMHFEKGNENLRIMHLMHISR